MEIFWERISSRTLFANEIRLIYDGKLTGYKICFGNGFKKSFICLKNDSIVGFEISMETAKKWCERDYKLSLIIEK